ncbi:hypothetical protein PAHAL_3G112100 [Panicum hallii]|uniref:Uncharacterized protein n=1 Tax=Panicum hallii TaxID=206008 RepID=A0A2T8KHU6_9POAL|nr:hypothetical protein PAHAL_3G112100 [Panicum hallii]
MRHRLRAPPASLPLYSFPPRLAGDRLGLSERLEHKFPFLIRWI